MPPLSILLPAYNAGDTLDFCLRSIQRQSYEDWECVVVDDGSTDATAVIADRFSRADRRFRVLRQSHRGIVGALHAGLSLCEGEHVARMDADDWMRRDRLAAQHAALSRDATLTAVGSHVRLFPRAGLRPGRLAYEQWLNSIRSSEDVWREAFVECPIAHPTLVIRRDVLQTYGYRECPWPEDYDLVLRLLADGHRLGVVGRRLVGWRDAPSRLSRTDARCSDAAFTRCKAHHLAATFLRDCSHYVLWGYGGTGKALRRELAALGRAPSHIVELHPRRLGERIFGAPVISPERLATLPEPRIVASVAGRIPRAEIRACLADMGLREGADFICAA